ncbi:zinc-binding dehydrogenase [Microbacterium rhizomatis]|uniref:Zinc-binding dehydrogenase n=1 Tax=Microbacterium rhizomatis TaxID=1631477 RepID=A0A5J5J063_9MICO|nr:zinc-binding dehydrogenase [Microbacterium rhizomatis]KAA9105862.1 zinc-binding dehydrogenase [Microbacterium rhizomatis]
MTEISTMKAIRQDALGAPEVLREVRLPKPEPRLGEILVAVHAAGLNPTDWVNRSQVLTIDRLPLVLGWDVSGVVDSVGVGVTLFKPGDEVFGMLPYPEGVGSHAEFVAGPSHAFVHKPDGLDHVHAAALPLAGLTAYQALVETAGVTAGQRVVIHAAAGGVGHLAVQIAKARGAYVIGAASASKHDFVRSLGADEVVEYRDGEFSAAVADVDVVLDSISVDAASRGGSLRALRRGGTLVSIRPAELEADERDEIAARGIRYESLIVASDQAGMRAIADLVDAGELRPRIFASFPLSEAARAHALGEARTTLGKIVLTVHETRKAHVAADVLRAVFEADGDTAIVDTLVRPDYIQHNPLAPDGPEAMKAFGGIWKAQYPKAVYLNKRAITGGDMAVLHTHVITAPGTPGLAVFDIFRFQDGKIAEHWDILQPVDNDDPAAVFATLSEPRTDNPGQRWFTSQHERVITDYVARVLVGKNLAEIGEFVSNEYHEHGLHIPQTGNTLETDLRTYFAQHPQGQITPKRVIAEGDLVAVHSHYQHAPDDRGWSVVDLFRVRDLKIVEHWSAAQEVPESAANDNTMF